METESLKQESSELQSFVEKLQVTLQDREKVAAAAVGVGGNNQKIMEQQQAKIVQLSEEIKLLNKKIEAADQEMKKRSEVADERDRLRYELDELSTVYEKVVKAQQEQTASLNSANRQDAQSAVANEQKVQKLSTELVKLDKQLKTTDNENKDLRGKLEQSLQAVQKLQAQINETGAKSSQDVAKMAEENTALKGQLTKLQQQAVAVQQAAAGQNQGQAQLSEEVNRLRAELERQRNENKKWTVEAEALRKQLERTQNETRGYEVVRMAFAIENHSLH